MASKTISMLELRQQAADVVRRIDRGERLVLTYRGRRVARLEPIRAEVVAEDDPFYALPRLATEQGASLDNDEIDDILYGS